MFSALKLERKRSASGKISHVIAMYKHDEMACRKVIKGKGKGYLKHPHTTTKTQKVIILNRIKKKN